MRSQDIILDDFLPCKPFSGPMFARSKMGDLWVMMIEKLFAKVYGGYNKLQMGTCRSAFVDLTGCPVLTIKTEDFKTAQFENSFFEPKYQFFLRINKALRVGYLVTCGSNEGELAHPKLIGSHAYSLFDIVPSHNEDEKELISGAFTYLPIY